MGEIKKVIKYIVGRAGSGKSKYIVDDIKEKLKQGSQSIYVIVPDQYTYETEKQLIDVLGGLMYVEVLSLKRLLYRVLSAAGGAKEHYVSNQGRAMLILKALQQNEIELSVLKKEIRSDSFYKNMSELIANFKRFCTEPNELISAIEKIDNQMTKDKLLDIASIYTAVNNIIAPYKDSEDIVLDAANRINGAEFLRGSHIYFDGFETTANAMNVIVQALLPVCESVNISFRMDANENSELFSIERGMLNGFRNIAEKMGENEEFVLLPLPDQKLPQRNEELKLIESDYFEYPFKEYEKQPENVKVYIAENTIDEANNIAKTILSLTREKNYKYNQITVIVPDINEQGRIVSRALREHGIEYYMDEKRSIYESPFPEFILKSLSIAKRGINAEDILALFKTGLLVDDETASDLCHYILEKGIDTYKFLYPFEDYRDKDLESIREKIIGAYEEFIEKASKALSYEHVAKSLYQLIEKLDIQKTISDMANEFLEIGESEIASVQAQCYNACISALDDAVLYLKNTEVSIESFIQILKAGFSMVEIGVIPGHGDAVLIGDLKRSMIGEIKALFIMGCQEGILPRVPDSGLLLSDDDVNALKEVGLIAGNDGSYLEAQDNLNLYRAFSKPSERIYISYALKDAGERILRPSSIISRIKELFPKLKEKSFADIKPIDNITAPLPTAIYAISELRDYIDSQTMASETKEAYRQLNNMPINTLIDIGEKALYYDGARNAQNDSVNEKVSASKIETYAKCPFMFLSQYLLNPNIVEPYELTPISQGQYFHKCLEQFTKQYLIDKDLSVYDEEGIKENIKSVIEKTANDESYLLLRENARNEYMIKKAGELAYNTAFYVYKYLKESKFKPFNSELQFKDDSGYRIYEQTLLEGVIDRIDSYEKDGKTYYSIIDYKSSTKEIDFADVYNGLSLQPLLYLSALLDSKLKEGLKAVPAGAFYLKVDDPISLIKDDLSDLKSIIDKKYDMNGVRLKDAEIGDALDPNRDYIPGDNTMYSLTDAAFNNLIEFSNKKAAEIIENIKSGNMDINPIKKKDGSPVCQYCNYRDICGYDEALNDNRQITPHQKDMLLNEIEEVLKDEK